MTTAKQVKQQIIAVFLKTLKVKKTWQSVGHDHDKKLPVKLEDFDISFEVPFDFGTHGFESAYHRQAKNNKFDGDIRIRTLLPNQTISCSVCEAAKKETTTNVQ